MLTRLSKLSDEFNVSPYLLDSKRTALTAYKQIAIVLTNQVQCMLKNHFVDG